jgi:hypothetical protein
MRRKRYAEDPHYRERLRAIRRAADRRRQKEKQHWDAKALERERVRIRRRNLRDKYKFAGMTLEKFDRMLVRQRGLCRICRRETANEVLCIDHRHATGWIRGLLCNKCNIGLGVYQDHPGRLVRAAAYLIISLVHETASRLLGKMVSFGRRGAAGIMERIRRARP